MQEMSKNASLLLLLLLLLAASSFLHIAMASSQGYLQFTEDAKTFPAGSEYDCIIVGGKAAADEYPSQDSPASDTHARVLGDMLFTKDATLFEADFCVMLWERGMANSRGRVQGGGCSINADYTANASARGYMRFTEAVTPFPAGSEYDYIIRFSAACPLADEFLSQDSPAQPASDTHARVLCGGHTANASSSRGTQADLVRDGLMEAGVCPFSNTCTVERETGTKVGGAIFDAAAAGRRHLLSNTNPALPGEFVTLGDTQYVPRRMLRDKPTSILPSLYSSGQAPSSPATRSFIREHREAIIHTGFLLGTVYNVYNWILIIRFGTSSGAQSWWNFISLLIGASPTLLLRKRSFQRGDWQTFKVVMNIVTTSLGVYGDSAVYQDLHHFWVALGFLLVEVIGLVTCLNLGHSERAVQVIRGIKLGSALLSSCFQFAGLLLFWDWEYMIDEAYAAFLGVPYALCGLADTRSVWVIVVIGLTTLVRFVYGLSIIHRAWLKNMLSIIPQIFWQVVDLSSTTRGARSASEICDQLWKFTKKSFLCLIYIYVSVCDRIELYCWWL